MKMIAIAILLILLLGSAGAVTIPSPTYNYGPQSGFKNPGTIQASDLYAEDDFKVGGDAEFVGNVDVAGVVAFDNSYVDGTFAVNETTSLNVTTMTDGYASGTFGVAGVSSLNGTTTTYLTDSGDASIGGVLGVTGLADLNATEATTLVASGNSYQNQTYVTGIVNSGTSNLNGTSVTTLSASGASDLVGAVTTTSTVMVGDALTANSGVVNTTLDVNGVTTASDITIDANKNITLSGTGIISGAASVTATALSGALTGDVTGNVTGTGASSFASAYVSGGANVAGTSGLNATEVTSLVASGDSFLNGTTIGTGDTLAVTSTDSFTVASVIVPVYETFSVPIGENMSDSYAFVADDAWWLVKVEEVHSDAGTNTPPTASNLTIRICDDTEAPSAGINATTDVIPLGDAANTINTASLNSTNSQIANGDMIGLDFAGDLTGLEGVVTFTLRRM